MGGRVETAAATGSGSAQTREQLLLAGRAPNGGAAAVGSVGDADLLSRSAVHRGRQQVLRPRRRPAIRPAVHKR